MKCVSSWVRIEYAPDITLHSDILHGARIRQYALCLGAMNPELSKACTTCMYVHVGYNYTGHKYYGRKGFYAMCAGDQTEPGGAIHILLL